MDFSGNYQKPPPGFNPNYVPNIQVPSLSVPPPNMFATAPPSFAGPPPVFNHPAPVLPPPTTTQFNVPPPRFSAPPPNWSTTAPPPPNFNNHYQTNNQQYTANTISKQQQHNPNASTRFPVPSSGLQQTLPMNNFRFPPPQPHSQAPSKHVDTLRKTTQAPPPQITSGHSNTARRNVSSNAYSNRKTSASKDYSANARSQSLNTNRDRFQSDSNRNRYQAESSRDRSQSESSCDRPWSESRDRSNRDHRDSKDRERHQDRSSSRSSEYKSSSTTHGGDRNSDRYVRNVRSERGRNVARSRPTDSRSSHAAAAHSKSNSQEEDGSERDQLLTKWRSNYCEHYADIERKLTEMDPTSGAECWVRSSPSDIYYERTSANTVVATNRLDALCTLFESDLVQRGVLARSTQPPYVVPPRRRKHRVCRHKSEHCSSSDSSDGEFNVDEDDCSMEELSKKIQHPQRLHPDLWHNEAGEMNDGPLCRCSAKSKRSGIRHGIYPGETKFTKCDDSSNNPSALHHYRITISPPTNFLTKTPTIIKHDQHEFIFEGFSLLSHSPIGTLPTCKVIRFNIEYTILYIEEKMPENFTIRELDLFYNYLFIELLELVDLNLKPGLDGDDSCPSFHFLPRFVRDLPDNGKEVLAMADVLRYLLDNSGPLVPRATLVDMPNIGQNEWQNYVDSIKDMVVTNPGKKPCSVRVDQLDRNVADLPECVDPDDPTIAHPVIVHFGIRPPQLSYAGNPDYQKAWREYVKFRHLVANMSKPSYDDKRKLESKEARLQEMRTQSRMKRNITVAISSKGFYRTGIMCDIVQHAMLIPVLATHLRFHSALNVLETKISYTFQNRYILQLALTHPSYKENFGTNPDHARNSLTNCGIRQPEYGDRKIHYMNTRKRGINTLINIMSRFGKELETDSNICHNERLEFLGDAVVEFLTSIHLFFMFPELEEGGLATYRAAIVENQHLAVLAKKFQLEEFMLYAHGSDLCHELELRHAMANCFEALMGSLLLDGGIKVADKVFALALFKDQVELKRTWDNLPPHPLQEQEPLGDRQWIDSYQMLQDLVKFEEAIGISFRHIRLLARAFTDRSIGYTHLTMGSNQRLEFLGDTVLQFICSEFLYRHFPEHHEGHLSLLRSSLVNNRTQAVVCDDLGMTKYAVYSNSKPELKTKDRADLLEAFLGSLYVDRGLEPCEVFCQVCLFPRLQQFIMNQDWNDPKSKLQQCCLTLRTMDGAEPDIPVYKVIECMGPTNTRVYTVAVYFRGKRLASSNGHSIQQAEMNAAKAALDNSKDLFPQLDHQKRVIAQSIKRQKGKDFRGGGGRQSLLSIQQDKKRGTSKDQRQNALAEKRLKDESNLPKQYRMRGGDLSDATSDSDESTRSRSRSLVKKNYSGASSPDSGSDSSSSRQSVASSSRASRASCMRSPKSKKRKINHTKSTSECDKVNTPNRSQSIVLGAGQQGNANTDHISPPKSQVIENSPCSTDHVGNTSVQVIENSVDQPITNNNVVKPPDTNVCSKLPVTHKHLKSASEMIKPPGPSQCQTVDAHNKSKRAKSNLTPHDPRTAATRPMPDTPRSARILSCSSLSSDDDALALIEAKHKVLLLDLVDDSLEMSSDIDSVESGEIIS